MHGENRGIEDIYLVDLLRGDDAYSPGYSIALDDLTKLIALLLRQLLGIVQQFILVVLWQYDGSRIDTTRQTTTPGLIATCLNLALVIMTGQHDSEHLGNAADACHEDINLLLGVVEGKRGANGA